MFRPVLCVGWAMPTILPPRQIGFVSRATLIHRFRRNPFPENQLLFTWPPANWLCFAQSCRVRSALAPPMGVRLLRFARPDMPRPRTSSRGARRRSNLALAVHLDLSALCHLTRIRIPLAMTRSSYLIPTNSFRIYHTHQPPTVKQKRRIFTLHRHRPKSLR